MHLNPFRGRTSMPFDFGLLERRQIVLSVTRRQDILLSALLQFDQRVTACRFEKSIEGYAFLHAEADKRFGDQVGDRLQNIRSSHVVALQDRASRVKGESAGENRQSSQDRALGLRKELVAPIERRAQCLMPAERSPAPADEQPKSVVQA